MPRIMRHINKQGEPRDLQNWRMENKATPQNLHYDNPTFPKEAVRQALLAEQHYLCAYTMKRLLTLEQCKSNGESTSKSCHIEHYLPQARGIVAETIDYANLLACYPPEGVHNCKYGAVYKADFDPASTAFASPLHGGTESHFRFRRNGEIEGLTDAGRKAIDKLNLNHTSLVNDRKAAIDGRLAPRKDKTVSAKEARRIADNDMQTPDQNNALPAFCVAIAQVLHRHAEQYENRAKRTRNRA